jgi:uncharacterized membrane protein YdjX (TVP38/TMEM64 family)
VFPNGTGPDIISPVKSNVPRYWLLAVLCAGVAAFMVSGGYRFLSFDQLVTHKDALIAWADARPVLAAAVWLTAYLILGLFGLPGSTVLNVSAGLLFDFQKGLALVVFASTLASSIAFLSFRYLFRDWVEERSRRQFPHLVDGLEREGLYFVFTLRLLPVIPYSVTNLLVAVSPVRFWSSLLVSLVALMPRYLLYVYAGSHLGDLQSPSDLLSPKLIGVLSVLAVIPWVVHWTVQWWRRRPGTGRASSGESRGGPRNA